MRPTATARDLIDKTARRGTVALAVKRMVSGTDRQIALGRRAARMRRIDRLGVAAEVLEYPIDHRRRLDARDHPQPPAAAAADLNVDGKALRPGQTPSPVAGQWFAALPGLVGSASASSAHDPRPIRARRREHAVIAGQVRSGLRHQRREPRDEVLGLEDHVSGAVAIRRLQCVAQVPALGQRQPLGGHRGP
jgi:hypothetical protein